jgi:hypothetical protein
MIDIDKMEVPEQRECLRNKHRHILRAVKAQAAGGGWD